MRNLRKLTAVVIAIALVLTSMTAAFAASTYSYEAEATVLQDLDIWQGGTNGDLMLGKELTRAEGAVLVLKTVLGKTEADMEAADTAALSTFADAAEVPAWAEGWVALAVKEGVVKGSNNNLNAGEPLLGKDLASMFMNALGFAAENEYGKAVELLAAKSTGTILADIAADITNEALTRDVASALVFDALTTTAKDATKTLIETYIGSDAAKLAVAQEAGLVAATATATVAQTGAKILTAKFSTAVDTAKAAFAIKKGTVTINVASVEWNTAKTQATITTVSNLADGDYVVTISGLDVKDPITVTAAAQKVASIEITSDVAPLVSGTKNVTIPYVVKNQFGENVTSTYGGSVIWTPSVGSIAASSSSPVTTTGYEFAKDATFTVTAIYATTNVSTTKLMKVGDVAKVAKINVLGLYNVDGKTLYTDSTFGDFYIKVEAFDQYGNAASLAQLNDNTQVTVVSSNGATVVTKGSFVAIDDTDYTGKALQLAKPDSNVSGTSIFTFFVNSNGTSAQQTVVVEKPATLTRLTLEAPADLVVAGESVKIPFTAQDQNGVELSETAKAAIDASKVIKTSTGLTPTFGYNYKTKKAELTLAVADDVTTGSKVLMAVTDAGNVSQITVDVKAVAIPQTVSGVKDVVKLLTVGATSTISDDNITVIDQHGRTMTLDATWFSKYGVKISSATTSKVTASSVNVIDDVDDSVNLGGIAAGTSVITVSLVNAADADIADTSYQFTAQTVEKSAITDYVVETPAVLYTAADHAKAVAVYGKTASGTKVALNAADYVVKTNDQYVTYSTDTKKLSAVATGMSDNTEKTVTVIAIIAGADTKTISNTVTVTNKTKVVKTLSLAEVTDAITVSGDTLYVKLAALNGANLVDAVTAVDQYDVDIDPSVTNLLITNLDGLTVSSNGTLTPAFTDASDKDSFTLTYVTSSGLSKVVTVVVVP